MRCLGAALKLLGFFRVHWPWIDGFGLPPLMAELCPQRTLGARPVANMPRLVCAPMLDLLSPSTLVTTLRSHQGLPSLSWNRHPPLLSECSLDGSGHPCRTCALAPHPAPSLLPFSDPPPVSEPDPTSCSNSPGLRAS